MCDCSQLTLTLTHIASATAQIIVISGNLFEENDCRWSMVVDYTCRISVKWKIGKSEIIKKWKPGRCKESSQKRSGVGQPGGVVSVSPVEWCRSDWWSGVGQTGGVVSVRPVEWCRSDRWSGVGQPGGVVSVRPVEWCRSARWSGVGQTGGVVSVSPVEWCRSDRWSGVGQTGGVVSVRPVEWCRSDRWSGVGQTGGVVNTPRSLCRSF